MQVKISWNIYGEDLTSYLQVSDRKKRPNRFITHFSMIVYARLEMIKFSVIPTKKKTMF